MFRYNCRRYKDLANVELVAAKHFSLVCQMDFSALAALLLLPNCLDTLALMLRSSTFFFFFFYQGPLAFSFDRDTNWPVLHGTEADIRYQMELKNWVSGLTARSVLKPGEKRREKAVLLQR